MEQTKAWEHFGPRGLQSTTKERSCFIQQSCSALQSGDSAAYISLLGHACFELTCTCFLSHACAPLVLMGRPHL